MIDLGISSPEVGVAAPGDAQAQMILKDDSGARTRCRSVQIEPVSASW